MGDSPRALVTGAAGFIGSQLTERLLQDGWSVRAVDSLNNYYDVRRKLGNLAGVIDQDAFELLHSDLCDLPLAEVLDGCDVVFHLAAQAGVRTSWSSGFSAYVHNNVVATQSLLEACKAAGTPRFVFASSSSVYGNQDTYPVPETASVWPASPYGVTKVAGERLVAAYAQDKGSQAVSLRYFTVYGPRQRPEMAISQIISAAATGRAFTDFSPVNSARSFTFVDDIVTATIAASTVPLPQPHIALNIASQEVSTLDDIVRLVEEVSGHCVRRHRKAEVSGDVVRTNGTTELARQLLQWQPSVSLAEGVARQWEWSQSGGRAYAD